MPKNYKSNLQTYYYKGKAYDTIHEVAEIANVSVDKVRQCVKNGQSLNDLSNERKRIGRKDHSLVNIKLKGKIYETIEDIAKEYHCSPLTVRKYIKQRDAGLPVEDIWKEE